jgi:hypothetical protein
VVADDVLIEVYWSDASGTWSIVGTDVDGRSCLLVAGDNWTILSGPLPGVPG